MSATLRCTGFGLLRQMNDAEVSASSVTAQAAHAVFLFLVHNLMVCDEAVLAK